MKLTFNTSAGNVEDDFPTDQPLEALKRDVMVRLKLDPEQAGQYVVACEGKTLNEDQTLGELALPDDSLLIIWRTGASATGRSRTWDRTNE